MLHILSLKKLPIILAGLLSLNVVIAKAHIFSIEQNPYQYSGEYADQESGFQYLDARYYRPALQRFISWDTYPLLNRYAYADGDPIGNEDPSGHISNQVEGIISNVFDAALGAAALGEGASAFLSASSTAGRVGMATSISVLGSTVPDLVANNDPNLSESQAEALEITAEASGVLGSVSAFGQAFAEENTLAAKFAGGAAGVAAVAGVMGLVLHNVSQASLIANYIAMSALIASLSAHGYALKLQRTGNLDSVDMSENENRGKQPLLVDVDAAPRTPPQGSPRTGSQELTPVKKTAKSLIEKHLSPEDRVTLSKNDKGQIFIGAWIDNSYLSTQLDRENIQEETLKRVEDAAVDQEISDALKNILK